MRVIPFLVLLLCATFVYAADTPILSTSGVKVQFKGDASTYNPNLPGWRTGGQGLATGGRYNPNAYEAALQLDLATKHGCGRGAGKTCFAIVQTQEGPAAIVKINDNGPLVPGRIIDLNEKSMQYLSSGKYGRNSGVLKNVTVGLLNGNDHTPGPVSEADRKAWADKMFNTPTDSAAQSSYASQSGYTSSGSPSSQPIGSAYQAGQPQANSQAFPSQYAQPVGQSAQYFSPTQPSGLSSFPGLSLTPLSSASSSSDKLLELLGISSASKGVGLSAVEIGTTTSIIGEDLSENPFGITYTDKPGVSYVLKGLSSTTGKQSDTFGKEPEKQVASTSGSESSNPVIGLLVLIRDALQGVVATLRALLGLR